MTFYILRQAFEFKCSFKVIDFYEEKRHPSVNQLQLISALMDAFVKVLSQQKSPLGLELS